MVERPDRVRKVSDWACTQFPRCQFTLPARAAAAAGTRQRRYGALNSNFATIGLAAPGRWISVVML